MTSEDDETARAPPPGDGGAGRLAAAGSLLGEYRVLKLLGAGAHGAVYLAEHRVLGRRAAVKVLHRELAGSREMTARFVREARAVNQIGHPGIVDIYDLGALADGRPFCVMELLPGRTLRALLEERAPLSPAEALAYLEPVCQALAAAHAAGVVHRDIKASNVMVLSEGVAPRVKLLDFGVAKLVEPGADGLTAAGQRVGTPSSMSPEQVRGEVVDHRADVYALGVLLHQMLTGHHPFEANSADELERMHLEATPQRPSALAPVPPALDAVVARCLEKGRERRWPAALALLEAARAALGTGPTVAPRSAPAVGVHVALRLGPGPPLQALAAQADAADAAEAALRGAGFTLALGTAGALLGVRLLPDDPGAARAARREAVTWARALATSLERSGVEVAVCVHAAEAAVRDTAAGPEFAGGPIGSAGWLPEGGPAFQATPAALAD